MRFEVRSERFARAEDEVGFEERITLWRAESFDDAITQAVQEAHQYVEGGDDIGFTGLAQAYHLAGNPGHGQEVFSLIRRSALADHEYLAHFFATGREGSIEAR
jgi:hypothetical protein